MDGLKTQLHPKGLAVRQPFQHGHDLFPQAVRPGGDGKGHNVLPFDGPAEQPLQFLHIPVGVGEGLEVGDIFGMGTGLGGYPRLCCFHLCRNIPYRGKGPGAVTEDAPAPSILPVGTGAAGGQGQLIDLGPIPGL